MMENLIYLKMNSFLTCQTTHKRAQTPTLIFDFSFLTTPLRQFPNKLSIEDGGVILKAI
jgi:hypothetical protein